MCSNHFKHLLCGESEGIRELHRGCLLQGETEALPTLQEWRLPSILRELAAAFPADSVVDGELVALDPSGKPSFSLIQNSATSGAEIVFFAFDLLRHAGKDLTKL